MGDEILAAGQAERLWLETDRRVSIRDLHGRPRWHPIWNGNPLIVKPEDPATADAAVLVNGPHCRPYIVYPFTAETGWTFNKDFRARENIASLFLTRDELQPGRALWDQFGRYVLFEPWSKHDNLRWPMDRWEKLIAFRRDLQFVQHVHKDSTLVLAPNVLHIATPSFRQACGVLAFAAAYVRGESGMCHAAAALDIPNVAIWGGCMDWDVMGGYPKQIGVGVSSPCGKYLPCPHCAKTMADISVRQVSEALDRALRSA